MLRSLSQLTLPNFIYCGCTGLLAFFDAVACFALRKGECISQSSPLKLKPMDILQRLFFKIYRKYRMPKNELHLIKKTVLQNKRLVIDNISRKIQNFMKTYFSCDRRQRRRNRKSPPSSKATGKREGGKRRKRR